MVTRPRLLVTLFLVCVVVVIVCAPLSLALVLPTRVTTAAVIICLVFLRARGFVLSTVSYYARLPTSVGLTVVTELSEVRIQAAVRVNKWVSTLLE